jgi:Kef-type K+ transport system membrane component KefB
METAIFLAIGLLLLFAKVFGEIAERFGVASLVGELIGGILLGPILGWVVLGNFMNDFITFGIIFILLIAGLEVKFEDIKKHLYMASFLAFMGGMMSFFLGFFVGMIFFNNIMVSIAIGVALVSTSNGTLFMILMRMGEFNTKTGKAIIATTIADDIVGILALSFLTILMTGTQVAIGDISKLFLISIGFYLFMLTFGTKALNRLMDFLGSLRNEYVLFTVPIIVTLILAYVTHHLSLSIAVGSFLAGVAMGNSKFTESVIKPKIEVMGYGFIIPLFYAAVGAMLVIAGIDIVLITALLVAAILGKFIGCGLLSKFYGYTWEEIKLFGLSMMPRGNENIGILQIIFLLGAITMQVYTSVLFTLMLTVILAPILLRIFYRRGG